MIVSEVPISNLHLAKLFQSCVVVVFDDNYHTIHLAEELEKYAPKLLKKLEKHTA